MGDLGEVTTVPVGGKPRGLAQAVFASQCSLFATKAKPPAIYDESVWPSSGPPAVVAAATSASSTTVPVPYDGGEFVHPATVALASVATDFPSLAEIFTVSRSPSPSNVCLPLQRRRGGRR